MWCCVLHAFIQIVSYSYITGSSVADFDAHNCHLVNDIHVLGDTLIVPRVSSRLPTSPLQMTYDTKVKFFKLQ